MMGFLVELGKQYAMGTLLFTLYLLLINVCMFTVMGIDKKRAKKDQWRIKELTLMLGALLGGAVGTIIGMVFFHHKLNKKKFYLGIPILYVVNKIVNMIFYYYLG